MVLRLVLRRDAGCWFEMLDLGFSYSVPSRRCVLFYSQQVCSDGGHDEDLALTVGHRSPYRYLHQQCTSDVLYKLVGGETPR